MAHGQTEAVVLRRRENTTARVTLNRPKALNALNAEVLSELAVAVESALTNPAIRVIVLDGAGDRAFCAGADLDELAGLDSGAALDLLSNGQDLLRSIEHAPKPVIAAVDGYALGGGFELALACHFILASDRARFGLPEATLGLIPGYGGTQRLVIAAGRQTALRLMLTGSRLTAGEAADAGLLALPPVPPNELSAQVDELVEQLGAATPSATQAVLAAIRDASTPAPVALALEAAKAAIAISSDSGQAGIDAFRARSKTGTS